MNKEEALKEMESGKKVTHRYFSSEEYMTMEKGRIVFEDGARCSVQAFFHYRDQEAWNDGYALFGDLF
jgi:hypothetical protein